MKKIGILGTGMVGKTIGSKLISLGFEVMMGSRSSNNEKAREWVSTNGSNASQGTFTEASSFGELIFNCTKGEHTLDALEMAGGANLSGKTLIDLSNPLDFSKGMPPFLIPSLVNTNSLGETIQAKFPEVMVVKTLNIVNCEVMVDATKCGGEASMFLAGNNDGAKEKVKEILNLFGWKDLIDLGDIVHARSTEMMLPIWLSTYMAIKNAYIAFKIVR
ncbi:MAG: NAD(P)-binding domain-containing protein [Cytophagales bacterium]